MVRRFAIVLTVLLAAQLGIAQFGCRACNDPPRDPIPELLDAAPAPALTQPPAAPDPRYQQDALWRRAMDEGDDIDLATLADREGATGLLVGFEQGGKVGRTAMAALPYASDATIAYRRLCEVALMTGGDVQHDVLMSIQQIALRPRELHEPVDEQGRESCARALLRIARDGETANRNRALAVSSLRLPAFAPLTATEPIPTLFDSPPASSSAP